MYYVVYSSWRAKTGALFGSSCLHVCMHVCIYAKHCLPKIMLRSFAKSICVAESSASTANQLYRQRKHQQLVRQVDKHKQSVIQAVQAEATGYTSNPGHEDKQLILHAAQSRNNQLYKRRTHKQPVIQAAQAQATSYTRGSVCLGPGLPV